jgi:hypothetical protein
MIDLGRLEKLNKAVTYLKEIQRCAMLNLLEPDNKKIDIYEGLIDEDNKKHWWEIWR